ERLNKETEVRHAIERDELVMHYQPILNIPERRWSGVEALVRWQHPVRGLVGPDEFVPVAEETGMIAALGAKVLEMVAAQAKAWSRTLPGIHLAVNASVVQLANPTFAQDFAATLERTGVPARILLVEVTESALMQELDTTRSSLEQLIAQHVVVLID